MKITRNVKTIFMQEIKRMTKNTRQMLTAIILPVAGTFFVLWGLSQAVNTDSANKDLIIRIYAEQGMVKQIKASLKNFDSPLYKIYDYSRFKKGQIQYKTDYICIAAKKDSTSLYYNSAHNEREDIIAAREYARQISLLTDDNAIKTYVNESDTICARDVSTDRQRTLAVLIPLISATSVISVMFVCMSLVTMAADTLAGERERGSFELLRLSGTSSQDIVAGKSLTLTVLSFMSVLLIIIAGMVYLSIDGTYCSGITASGIASIIITGLSTSIVLSGLFLFISSCFSKVQTATVYENMAMVICSILSSTSQFSSARIFTMMPITGTVNTLEKAIVGGDALAEASCQLVIAILISLALYIFTASRLKSDMSF